LREHGQYQATALPPMNFALHSLHQATDPAEFRHPIDAAWTPRRRQCATCHNGPFQLRQHRATNATAAGPAAVLTFQDMSTTKPSPRAPTLADLDALPPGIVGEIIKGVLYTMTKPRMRHQHVTLGIGADLRSPFGLGRGGPGGWWIIPEPGLELPNTPEISPDVAGWRRERMPEMPGDEPIRVVPDWVCEILSKTTQRHDQIVKMPYYPRSASSTPGSSTSKRVC